MKNFKNKFSTVRELINYFANIVEDMERFGVILSKIKISTSEIPLFMAAFVKKHHQESNVDLTLTFIITFMTLIFKPGAS